MRIASSSADEAAVPMAARASPATASTRGWLTPPSACLGLRGLGELGERAGVADRELGEHLAIEQHAGLLEGRHEARIGQPRLAAGRVDAHDPECALRALLLFEDLLAPLARLRSALRPWHLTCSL